MKEKLLIAALAVALSGTAFAAGNEATTTMGNESNTPLGAAGPDIGYNSKSWQRYDTNQDSYIDRNEIGDDQDLTAGWGDYDTNADDRLDQDEFARFENDSLFGDMDANDDDYLSQDEIGDNQDLSTRWSELDTDKDNRLSRDEYNAF